jgi:undecaprenyl-phosphate galactose phosphotransferase
MKMAFDLALALVTLVVMFPVMAAIACCIKAEDGGPVLFRQQRVGRNGRMFDCLKFRTMTVDAEQIFEAWRKEGGDQWKAYVAGNFKLKNDPRVTKVGRFLRSSSLDELPQIFNVLRGEMSLVGPRPMQYRETLIEKGRQVHYRRVRPGITGIWQISGRSETSFAERLAYDEWYCKNWSLWGDLVIIIKTISVLIGRKGAY